jgi:nucleoside-diphosphate-sugar epimerase
MLKKVIILGGCGYIGTKLTKLLLNLGYRVKIIDAKWYGNYTERNKNLIILKKDIRKVTKNDLKNYNIIVHLANIANDPSADLKPNLSWEINVLASYQLINEAIKAKISKFIYASSGSVYGIKKEKNVTEDLSLLPISTYNKTKMIAERVFLSFKDKIKVHCIRPATVCGYSPKMRLDLSVNLLTYQALTEKKITVLGGKQMRPNININDITRVFEFFIKSKKIKSGCYNAGFENMSILEIAKIIKKKIPSKIIFKKSNDPRSYRVNSSKLLNLGFKPIYSVSEAIDDIIDNFNKGKLKRKKNFFNIEFIKSKKLNEKI